MKKCYCIVLFTFLISCNHYINEEIEFPYYIVATEVESQANVSLYRKDFDAYIGLTEEGITGFFSTDNYILARKVSEYLEQEDYFVIRKGEDKSVKMDALEFKLFLNNISLHVKDIEWKEI